MNEYIIQIEPVTLEDYKQIIKERYGNLNCINSSEIRILEEYKSKFGPLKGASYDEVLEMVWETY